MNRRKAIFRISLAGAGILAAGTGYKWWGMVKKPDLEYLHDSKDLLAALGETIIPATDTPGARDVKVEDFIERMVRDCTPRKEQNTFIGGLKDLQDLCNSQYSKVYQRCSPQEQAAVLSYFEQKGQSWKGKAGKVELRLMGRSFFAILKDYTVQGYCTSMKGATMGLSYLYIPGAYKGCIPLQPGQKAWATS